jgi:hypothetical protein
MPSKSATISSFSTATFLSSASSTTSSTTTTVTASTTRLTTTVATENRSALVPVLSEIIGPALGSHEVVVVLTLFSFAVRRYFDRRTS